jgi:hypothetical protein
MFPVLARPHGVAKEQSSQPSVRVDRRKVELLKCGIAKYTRLLDIRPAYTAAKDVTDTASEGYNSNDEHDHQGAAPYDLPHFNTHLLLADHDHSIEIARASSVLTRNERNIKFKRGNILQAANDK